MAQTSNVKEILVIEYQGDRDEGATGAQLVCGLPPNDRTDPILPFATRLPYTVHDHSLSSQLC